MHSSASPFGLKLTMLGSVLTRVNLLSYAHALGGVSGVAAFITTDEQLQ